MEITKIENCKQDIKTELTAGFSRYKFSQNEDDLPKMSINIMVKNEERCIKRCLLSISQFADEIIIVDTGSTDKTIDIIQSFDSKIQIYYKDWNNDFSEIRNFMMAVSNYDWVFYLDADEMLKTDFTMMKYVMKMCDNYSDKYFFFLSPKLENSDGIISTHTRRIFPNKNENKFYGIIHEEQRVFSHDKVVDIFVDTIIYHDGYELEIMKEKDKHERNIKALEKMIIIEPGNPRWFYFLARDAYSSPKYLVNYTLEDVIDLLKKALMMKDAYPQRLEFIESSYILLGEIYMEKESFEKLFQLIKDVNNNFPKNVDSYYFEMMIDLTINFRKKQKFLNDIFQRLKNSDATNSRIDNNLTHIMLAFASGYFLNGDLDSSALFFDELDEEISRNYIENRQKDLQELKRILNIPNVDEK